MTGQRNSQACQLIMRIHSVRQNFSTAVCHLVHHSNAIFSSSFNTSWTCFFFVLKFSLETNIFPGTYMSTTRWFWLHVPPTELQSSFSKPKEQTNVLGMNFEIRPGYKCWSMGLIFPAKQPSLFLYPPNWQQVQQNSRKDIVNSCVSGRLTNENTIHGNLK